MISHKKYFYFSLFTMGRTSTPTIAAPAKTSKFAVTSFFQITAVYSKLHNTLSFKITSTASSCPFDLLNVAITSYLVSHDPGYRLGRRISSDPYVV